MPAGGRSASRLRRGRSGPLVAPRSISARWQGGGVGAEPFRPPRASFDRIVAALTELEEDETLLVRSGKPVGIFQTHADAPRG